MKNIRIDPKKPYWWSPNTDFRTSEGCK